MGFLRSSGPERSCCVSVPVVLLPRRHLVIRPEVDVEARTRARTEKDHDGQEQGGYRDATRIGSPINNGHVLGNVHMGVYPTSMVTPCSFSRPLWPLHVPRRDEISGSNVGVVEDPENAATSRAPGLWATLGADFVTTRVYSFDASSPEFCWSSSYVSSFLLIVMYDPTSPKSSCP